MTRVELDVFKVLIHNALLWFNQMFMHISNILLTRNSYCLLAAHKILKQT